MEPLNYPEIPDYLQVPSDLEEEFQTAMAARCTAEGHLRVLAAEPDPSLAQSKAQLALEIALACAKLASTYAICQISDWVEAAEEPPTFRWRTATRPKHCPSSNE